MARVDCWNQIGINGDRSCNQLESVLHCQNCPVYTDAGYRLFEREASPEYLQEWAQILAAPLEVTDTKGHTTSQHPSSAQIPQADDRLQSVGKLSVILFRIGREHFALPTAVLQEVTPPVIPHRLPHRSDSVFTGLVNIRGEILPCASLSQLLEIETSGSAASNQISQKRMLVVQGQETRWVLPVDQIYRITRFSHQDLQEPPIVTTKAAQSFTQNLIYWQDKSVSFLDVNLLLCTLDRRVL